MKRQYILILIIVSCIICCKKDQNKCVYYFLNDREKRYCAFQIGSYWIYQNDSTFDFDSIYVNNINPGFINDCYYRQDSHDIFSCNAKSTLDTNINIGYSIEATGENSAVYYFGGGTYSGDALHASWQSESYLFTNPTGDQFYQHLNQLNAISQLTINGILYTSVYDFKESNHTFTYSQIDSINIFIVKDLGIIKWTLQYPNGSFVSWSLVRHHIVF